MTLVLAVAVTAGACRPQPALHFKLSVDSARSCCGWLAAGRVFEAGEAALELQVSSLAPLDARRLADVRVTGVDHESGERVELDITPVLRRESDLRGSSHLLSIRVPCKKTSSASGGHRGRGGGRVSGRQEAPRWVPKAKEGSDES
jgi:hypothetical protein